MTKKVYACFCTDMIHDGHIKIIERAKELGDLTVGVLGDSAMLRYRRFPACDADARAEMFRAVPGVSKVIIQQDVMYDDIIKTLRPDMIVHGDNWREGPISRIRENVIRLLGEYGGELIEFPYTRNAEVEHAERKMRDRMSMPEYRRRRLGQIMRLRPIVKAIEVHSGLTGLIAEKTVVMTDDGLDQFDAMWISSLCDSTSKGKPDIELVDMTSRFRTIDEVMEVTTKPIIFDGDTGGLIEHFVFTVRSLERMGVSAVIIEDKIGLKRNSLLGTDVVQEQDSTEHFCEKITKGKHAQLTDEFMLIARIESLVLGKGADDAVRRACAYTDAGADAIMVSSRSDTPDELFRFCASFRAINGRTPIVAVPSSYSSVTEEELAANGVNVVIYANQLMRSSYPAMEQTAVDILTHHRASAAESRLMSIKDILHIIESDI